MLNLPLRAVFGVMLVAPLLVSCVSEDPTHPDFDADPIVLTPASQWAGGAVMLESAAFAQDSHDSAQITIAGLSATAIRIDPTRFRVTLPPTAPGGPQTLTVTVGGGEGSAELVVAGVVATEEVAVLLYNPNPQPWPWDLPTGLLGTTNDGVPVYVDARTGATAHFTSVWNYGTYAPGTSYRPDIALVRDSTGLALYSLDLLTGDATVDTIPGTQLTRQAYELSVGRILLTGSHYTSLIVNDSAVTYSTESPWYLIRSPAGGLATFVVNAVSYNGTYELPIFSVETQAVVQNLVGIGSTDAAAWATDGSSLYLAARPYWAGPQRIVRIDPADGTELAVDSLAGAPGSWWLAVDPQHDWLYDLGGEGEVWTLRIRDPLTLALLGAPEFDVPANYIGDSFPLIVPDPSHGKVHVMYQTPTGVKIHHLTLP